jgi:hypothetical protein
MAAKTDPHEVLTAVEESAQETVQIVVEKP